jgi:hypothetical protein
VSENEVQKVVELRVFLDEDSIVGFEASEGADLYSLIVMCETAKQLLMSQYFAIAAAKMQRKEQFKPKLLVPNMNGR